MIAVGSVVSRATPAKAMRRGESMRMISLINSSKRVEGK